MNQLFLIMVNEYTKNKQKIFHLNIFQIFFYDFGTVQKYKKEKVYLLDKRFTDLSAQAILCGLSDVKPRKSEDKKWPVNCSQKFSEKVLNERFHAYISKIDEQVILCLKFCLQIFLT